MKKKPRYFTVEEKLAAVKRVSDGEAVLTVARDIGGKRDTVYKWCRKYRAGGPDGLRRTGRPRKSEGLSARVRSWQEGSDEGAAMRRHIAELQRKIGEQQVDLDFFRKALRHIEETRQAPAGSGGAASTKSSKR
jgi:transposase-like protein